MITVTRRILSEGELMAKLCTLAQRYQIPDRNYDEAAADRMSDFDAMKWTSLCAQLRAVRQRRRQEVMGDSEIPVTLRSIYGAADPSQYKLENTCDLIELAA